MNKINVDNLFKILSEVSDESVDSSRPLLERMSEYQLLVDEKMYDLMKNIHYEKKFAILDDLKQIGKNISILLHFPQLIGKTIVGIDSLPPAKARDIYKILLSGDFDNVIQDESLVDKLRGTTGKITVSNLFPTIVSSEVQEISVLNTAENDVTLTNRQYVDLLSSSVNEQLDLSSLVHAAAIPGKIVESKGLIIFPEKNDDDKKYYQSLTECVDILVIQGKNCEIDRLKRYSNVKYIYIAGKVSEDKKEELAKYFQKRHIEVKYGRSYISQIEEALLNEYEVNNCCFLSVINNALLEIPWYLANKHEQLESPMIMVNEDVVFKNKETQKILKGLQEKYKNEISVIEQTYSDYNECANSLRDCVTYVQENLGIYDDAMSEDGKICINQHVNITRILLDLIVKMMDTFQTFPEQNYKDVVRKKVAILSRITEKKYFEEVFVNILNDKSSKETDVELFMENIYESQFVNRFIIKHSAKLNLSDEKLVVVVGKIEGKLTAKEKLVLGKNELSNESIDLAKKYLYEAAREGNEEAGQILMTRFQLLIDEIKELADQGNKFAAYELGNKIVQNDPLLQGRFNEDDALKYLHIVASKKKIDAVKLLGDIWRVKVGDDDEKDKYYAENAYYYYRLAEKLGATDDSIMEVIGTAALLCEKNKKAMEYFKKADTMQAHYMLGGMYEEGLGCAVDRDTALEYYEQAMNEGHSDAAVEYERLNAEIEAELRKNTISDNTSYSASTYYSYYYSGYYSGGYSSGW